MKNTRINTILRSAMLASAVAIGLFAPTSNAQMLSTYHARVKIPFTFEAGSKQMPAGLYDISFQSERLLRIHQGVGKNVTALLAVAPSEDGKIQKTGRLVFERHGNQYFLHEMWQAESPDGVICFPNRENKTIARSQKQKALTQVAVNVEPNR